MGSLLKNNHLYLPGLNLLFALAISFSIFWDISHGITGFLSISLIICNLAFLVWGFKKKSKSCKSSGKNEQTDFSPIDPSILNDLDSELARRKTQQKLERN
ncbi:MAG: hypothetical protein EBU27_05065 [Opitutae bacterium]|jgi:hypothetical protein|nr:hypothetical protein [Opitutae bacterium]NBU87196.1 hypothetical protein [Verrucomicrobiota bacterium]